MAKTTTPIVKLFRKRIDKLLATNGGCMSLCSFAHLQMKMNSLWMYVRMQILLKSM